MLRFACGALAVLGLVGIAGAEDSCGVGEFHNAETDKCEYCTTVPLNGYYTGNGNGTNDCPYEICETCDNGYFNKGCGYDDQNADPPSICFGMTDFADICSAGPKYCTVQPTTPDDYDDCDDYCGEQQLTCLAAYTSTDGGCGDSLEDLTEIACSATMADETVCACHLDACAADIHNTGIRDCEYFADTVGYCPSFSSEASLENQVWAVQNCRVTCDACVTGEAFADGGQCARCSDIEEDTLGVYYSSDGDRSDACDVSECTEQCFVGEYNAGCGYDNFTMDTYSCALCKDTCDAGYYLSELCNGTGFEDTTECTKCSGKCRLGEYIANTCDGTSTEDTTDCVLCTAVCNPGYYIDGEFCTGLAYESQAECVECTNECDAGEFPSGSCDGSGTEDEVECLSCYDYCDKDCEDCSCFEPCFMVTVLGGQDNWALNTFDAVGGGLANQAGYLESDDSGYGDDDEFNVVIGGASNTVGGMYSSISGGYQNTAFGSSIALAGGESNQALKTGSDSMMNAALAGVTIGGGKGNSVSEDYSVVLGGQNNVVLAEHAGVLGGEANEVSGDFSVVLGGDGNSARGDWAGVGGGKLNKAWSNYASAPGGYYSKATARFSVAFGGSKNTAKGRYSFVMGFKALAKKDYSAVLGFSGDTCVDNGVGTFNICADYVFINGYDVTALLASASGGRSRRLTDGTEAHLNNDAEMRRLARDRGYTLEGYELEYEVQENDEMLKTIDDKLDRATASLQALEHLMQPATSLRSR